MMLFQNSCDYDWLILYRLQIVMLNICDENFQIIQENLVVSTLNEFYVQ